MVLIENARRKQEFWLICLWALRDTFFSNTWYLIRGGIRGLDFLVGLYSTECRNSNILASSWSSPTLIPFLNGHSDLLIRITLRRVLDLLTVMILKIVSESIFFKANKFTACKIKHDKFFDAVQATEDYSSISR